MKVVIHEELIEVVRAGIVRISGMELSDEVWEKLWDELKGECLRIGEQFKGMTAGQVPGVSDTRKLYRAVGLDPTKTRPSSEALLRRALKGKELYRIHPVVDLFNFVSLRTLLPLGLYDESKIVGDTVTIRLGKEGWSFPGIRKDEVNVRNRLCVADFEGPFGSPTSDSLRTCIEGQVGSALVILFQHAKSDVALLNKALDFAVGQAKSRLQARIDEKIVVGATHASP